MGREWAGQGVPIFGGLAADPIGAFGIGISTDGRRTGSSVATDFGASEIVSVVDCRADDAIDPVVNWERSSGIGVGAPV